MTTYSKYGTPRPGIHDQLAHFKLSLLSWIPYFVKPVKGSLKGMPPVQNEFDSSSVSTETEKNFASALADMNTGDVMEFGGDDDYEYMLNEGSRINFASGAFSNLAVTFDWLSRREAFLGTI